MTFSICSSCNVCPRRVQRIGSFRLPRGVGETPNLCCNRSGDNEDQRARKERILKTFKTDLLDRIYTNKSIIIILRFINTNELQIRLMVPTVRQS